MAKVRKIPQLSMDDAGSSDRGVPAPSEERPIGATFEDALDRLSAIVEQLESGELSLEQSLKKFEEGVRLARRSQKELDAAEKRVEQLLGFNENGEPNTAIIDSE